jgi:hypothetical protein
VGTGNFPPADGLWNVVLGWDVRYRYANGVELHFKHGDPFIRFEGTEGWINIRYAPRAMTAEPASILDSTLGPGDKRFPLKNEKREFIDCVRSRPDVGGRRGRPSRDIALPTRPDRLRDR